MTTTTKSTTPAIDADELATILVTFGACAVLFGALVASRSYGWVSRDWPLQWSWVPAMLFVVGAVCVVGGLIVGMLGKR